MLGDFNFPTLDWTTHAAVAVCARPIDRDFYDVFSGCGWTQWVDVPTFISSGNVLDLVLTSDTDRILEVYTAPPLPGCGHVPVMVGVVFQSGAGVVGDAIPKWDWFRGNYSEISSALLDIDWERLLHGLDVGSSYRLFLSEIHSLMVRYIPRRKYGCGGKWLVSPPRSLIRERAALWRAYKAHRIDLGRRDPVTLRALELFRNANYNYRNYARNRQAAYEQRLVDILGGAPKVFHSYIRERKVGCPTVGPLRRDDGSLISDDVLMAESFCAAFSSVFNGNTPLHQQPHQQFQGLMDDVLIGLDYVHGAIEALDSSSAAGADNVHPHFLKSCAQSVSLPLVLIFQRSLSEGALPVEWRIAKVVPIFKKGQKSEPLNYRPVSLTSTCCKVLERILSNHIKEYLQDNGILNARQFGFRSGMCAEDQLLLTYADVVAELDEGWAVDMVFLDFSKAFDVVSHGVILRKIEELGFCDQVVGWTRGFLSSRGMFVSVGGGSSSVVDVLSGVPQGSVLGPLLFLVYVNYLMEGVSSRWYAYADDFKLYVRTGKKGGCATELQRDLDIITGRSRSWNLALNASKCVVVRFGVMGPPDGHCGSGYFLDGVELKRVRSHVDLGVEVDPFLRFHSHIATIIRKASGLSNQLLLSTVCRSRSFMLKVFVAHIRPIMDYASSL